MNSTRLVALLLAGACGTSGSTPGPPEPRAPQVYGSYPPRDLQNARPQTRAERSGFTATSSHADVVAFLDSLQQASRHIHVTTLGRSSQGRDIPLVVASRPLVRTAAEAKRTNRPIVYLQ